MPETSKKTISEKLKSLGVRVGFEQQSMNAFLPKRNTIESCVDGKFISTRLGDVFMSQQEFSPDYQHGSTPLMTSAPLETIAEWTGDRRIKEFPIETFAFLDTETSGLAGGTGTFAFLVGIGRFIGSTFSLRQYFMRDPNEEPAMLETLGDFLAPCSILVTFNGKVFDAPLLNTRYALHQIPTPLWNLSHLDLLHLARRVWKDRLPSCSLKYLEENILRAPRTIDEVPGYEIPHIYFDYLRDGNAGPLKGVFYHNAMDVVALAALMNQLASILDKPLEKLEYGMDLIAVGKIFEELGQSDQAVNLYERSLQSDLDEKSFFQAIKYLSRLQFRMGNVASALGLWEEGAAKGLIDAHVALAKYHEHASKNIAEAMIWTEKALAIIKTRDSLDYKALYLENELEHRFQRLNEKIIRAKQT